MLKVKFCHGQFILEREENGGEEEWLEEGGNFYILTTGSSWSRLHPHNLVPLIFPGVKGEKQCPKDRYRRLHTLFKTNPYSDLDIII